MDPSILSAHLKSKSYLRWGVILLLILFAGKFVVFDALPYYGLQEETLGRFWSIKWWLIGHISGGLVALIIGPFQFWKTFRNRYMTVHRRLGQLYLFAILTGTVSSIYLAWTDGIKLSFSWAFSLQGLAFAWITTASMAYISVRKNHITQHKEWMIRSYVVTFAFVTFRWLSGLPIAIQLMNKFEERGPTTIWLSWTIPLLITEIVLSWKKE